MVKRVLLIAALALAIAWGFTTWRDGLIAKGDDQGAQRVQAAWDEEKAQQAQNHTKAEQQARTDELVKFRNAERVADEQARREALTQTRLAGAAAANRGLLDTIAHLNASLAYLSAPGADPRLAALAQEATTARELLGACSRRYLGVAGDAETLRDQVDGLLSFDSTVPRASGQATTP